MFDNSSERGCIENFYFFMLNSYTKQLINLLCVCVELENTEKKPTQSNQKYVVAFEVAIILLQQFEIKIMQKDMVLQYESYYIFEVYIFQSNV